MVYVSDALNHRIQRYYTDGRFIDQFNSTKTIESQLRYPWGITSGLDRDLYVADWGNDRIVRFDLNGNLMSVLSKGLGAELPLNPCSVMVDADSRVYVLETCRHRFQIFERI